MKLNIILLLFLSGCMQRSGLPDLRESYSYKSDKPFGTSLAKKIFENSYPDMTIQISKGSFIKEYTGVPDTNCVYICISKNLYLKNDEAQAMLDYVYMGNTVFIASSMIDTLLLEKIHCKQQQYDWIYSMFSGMYFNTGVSLAKAFTGKADSFGYYYKPFANHFSEIKPVHGKVTGYNAEMKPNALILPWGKGKLMLHCDPRAFSNYFLLGSGNYRYLQHLSELMEEAPDKIYWDDHYRNINTPAGGDTPFSRFSELMKHVPLALGLWIFVAMLLLYVLFNGKRKQRIIPVLKKNSNSSVAFAATIARLYLQQKDNKNIAEKMVTYFKEYIRNRYFLVNTDHEGFISVLSRKSGVSVADTTALVTLMQETATNTEVSDHELLSMNHYMQLFYKHKN